MGLQQLIEAEASDTIGAARYERMEVRVTERNGYQPRALSTKAGDLTLKIPKLREGSYFPSILEQDPVEALDALPFCQEQ